jgi:hypothetical protein
MQHDDKMMVHPERPRWRADVLAKEIEAEGIIHRVYGQDILLSKN